MIAWFFSQPDPHEAILIAVGLSIVIHVVALVRYKP